MRQVYYHTYASHHAYQLGWSAMYDGQHSVAAAAAATIVETTSANMLRKFAEHEEARQALEWYVGVRFGKWDDLLAKPMPSDPELRAVTTATAHWARAIALGALGRLREASAEAEQFERRRAELPPRRINVVPSARTLEVGAAMLSGELAYRAGDTTAAFDHLRRAVALEDALPYDEPAGWLTPVRSARRARGAILSCEF